jgi:hypothetical protein
MEYANTINDLTKEGYAEALKAAADEIKRRAVDFIGDIDFARGYEITICINHHDVVIVTAKKTILVPRPDKTDA